MEIVKTENGYVLDTKTIQSIVDFEMQMKILKAKEDELKVAILKEMEEKGIVKFENDELLINYIAPTTRESFDSKRLRDDNPDLYDMYIKLSKVKSSVRIKLK